MSDASNGTGAPTPASAPPAAEKAPFTLTAEQVRAGLLPITDPEIGISIVELGLIYAIDVDAAKRKVAVTMTFTSMACPVGPQILAGVEAMCRRMAGVEDAEVRLTFDPPWDPKVHCSEDAKATLGIWE